MNRILRRGVLAVGLAVPLVLAGVSPGVAAPVADAHKLAIHVDEDDPARITMALNNAQNARSYYASKGEEILIEIVAYGPGLAMLRKDTSPVADRISVMALEDPNMVFTACGNTHEAMSKKAGKPVELLAEATLTPSGVVRLMELQQQGYAYLRP
jgi:intracellular sulfur oxidation DsrE/DsrF family protein